MTKELPCRLWQRSSVSFTTVAAAVAAGRPVSMTPMSCSLFAADTTRGERSFPRLRPRVAQSRPRSPRAAAGRRRRCSSLVPSTTGPRARAVHIFVKRAKCCADPITAFVGSNSVAGRGLYDLSDPLVAQNREPGVGRVRNHDRSGVHAEVDLLQGRSAGWAESTRALARPAAAGHPPTFAAAPARRARVSCQRKMRPRLPCPRTLRILRGHEGCERCGSTTGTPLRTPGGRRSPVKS